MQNRNPLDLSWTRWKQKGLRTMNQLRYMLHITEPYVPDVSVEHQDKPSYIEPDVSTVRLPDCQPRTIRASF